MAHQQNGVSDNTSFMDVCSSNLGAHTNDTLSGLDVPLLNNHTLENDHAKGASCPVEEPITNVDCIGEPSKSGDDSSQQSASLLSESSIDPPDKYLGENIGFSQEEAIDVDDVEAETKETTSSKSIEALSLVDIKASFVNDQEIANCDADISKTDVNCPLHDLNVSDLDTQTQSTGFENRLHDEVSNLFGGHDRLKTVPDDSTSNSEPNDLKGTESNSNSQKVISSYAIQPGELTNQLIEGPSITLPSSELPNRDSSSSVVCDPTLGNHDLNINTSTSQSNINDKNSASESGAISATDIEPHNQFSNRVTCSAPGALSAASTTLPTSTTTTSLPSATTNTPIQSTSSTPAPAKRVKKTPHDFIFGKVLGEGSYSTVYLAKEVSTQREFAVKICEKKHLIREHKTHFVMREKEVLMKLDHPFFIRLAYTFQDPERLYYVLTYARNGELLTYLNKLSVFDVPCTRFYSAEVVVALEYLQSLGIVHRDMKPENILLGDDMHIKITDFGTSKILNGAVEEESKGKQSKRKNSFVGTAEYVSPEVLNGLPANYGTDLWALACIIYQCLSSSLPFRSGNEYQTFQKIIKLEYEFPEGFHEEAKDLVQRLLVIEPTERLGMKQPGGMEDLKQHPFFQGINWENLPTTTPPKLLPYLPASANNPEFWGGQEHRTGFDDQRLAEIITGQSSERSQSPELEPISVRGKNEMLESEWRESIEKQKQENQFHQFVENNIILRQGFVDKRKGFFARKRMLLLTEGPHLYYVDAHNKVLKGEIPWSKELRTEAKNFKIFFVHTPNRTYYLESRNPDAHHWVKRIQEVWNKYYGDKDSS